MYWPILQDQKVVFSVSPDTLGIYPIEFCQENTLVIPNNLFQQHKRWLYSWTSADSQHWNQIDYILAAEDGEALYCLQNTHTHTHTHTHTPGTDCGSDHELLIKVWKTTRPFRYDLNQTPYTYTVEVTNRFKGLNMIECLKNYGWRFVILYRRQ